MSARNERPELSRDIRPRRAIRQADTRLEDEYLVVGSDMAEHLEYKLTDVEGNPVSLVFEPVSTARRLPTRYRPRRGSPPPRRRGCTS